MKLGHRCTYENEVANISSISRTFWVIWNMHRCIRNVRGWDRLETQANLPTKMFNLLTIFKFHQYSAFDTTTKTRHVSTQKPHNITSYARCFFNKLKAGRFRNQCMFHGLCLYRSPASQETPFTNSILSLPSLSASIVCVWALNMAHCKQFFAAPIWNVMTSMAGLQLHIYIRSINILCILCRAHNTFEPADCQSNLCVCFLLLFFP